MDFPVGTSDDVCISNLATIPDCKNSDFDLMLRVAGLIMLQIA